MPVAELRCDQGRGTSVIVVACSPLNGFVLLFARGKGLRGAPKGWMIRKDRDRATGSGAIHYHCEKNGKEYVVKADGTGSHQTKSGTRLPPKLGEFLFKELGIPLKKVNDEFVVVRFIPFWRWNSSLERFAKDLLESALNADLVEQPGFATT